MPHDDLRKDMDQLRSALNIIESGTSVSAPPEEGLRDLGQAVDNVRKSAWAVLTAEHSGDYHGFLAKIRVRRAIELCQDVLTDLYADTITPDMPGLVVLTATLTELSAACKEVNA
jgi:hypothetical protein